MSDLALKLIAENKRTRSPFLDLGNCGLTKVPSEVADLHWLESISFSSQWQEWNGKTGTVRKSQNQEQANRIVELASLQSLSNLKTLILTDQPLLDLAPVANLSALQLLYVSYTKIANLAPVANLSALQSLYAWNTEIADLAPVAKLSALQSLNVSGTQITDLAPVAKLSALQSLDVSNTKIADLAPVANLSALQSLSVSNTKITELAPIANLSTLQSLNVSGTQITDLAPVANLSALQSLGVSGTQITDLAPIANLSALKSLGVSGTQITDLAPISNLSALQWLNISDTHITDLAPVADLSALQWLDVSGTQITDLAPVAKLPALRSLDVSKTKIANLVPVAKLSALKSLYVEHTKISDLAPIANLSALQSLQVSNTKIADLAPIANLSALQSLQVSNTKIADLAPVANLSALIFFAVSNTKITDLAPIANLSALQSLDVSNTQIKDLAPVTKRIQNGWPVKLSSHTWEGRGIYLKGCPLTNPPVEIASQGNEAILNYFAERARGAVDRLYEAKMLILGEGGAGKTSLVRRLYQTEKELPEEKDTTRGIEIHKHEFTLKNGRTFRLNVWDFGGQQIYHATHQFFLTHRSLYVLLDDTRKDNKSVSDEGFRNWLDLIDIFGGHSPTLIFQNEKGGRSKAIDFDGIKHRYNNVEKLYNGNLESPRAADGLRDAIEFYVSHLGHIGEELPASWVEIRGEIERLAAEQPYISIDKFLAICAPHLQSDEARALHLSRYLHDLGVFLHFQDDPLLRRTVILQNEWATTAVFRVLDDEIVKKKLGRFTVDDCERLWRGTGYDRMHFELQALMQNFELCYEQSDCVPRTWLVPQLLPPAKPSQLANWAQPVDLTLRYKYEFLPKGMISRLTVRKHRFVRDPEQAWVTGVLFAQDSTEVLVEVLPDGSEIEFRARGPENKALLSVIAADLEALNDGFQGLRDKVDKRIPCNCKVCIAALSPEFYSYKELVRRKEHSKLQIECPRSFENVSVLELLDGTKAEAQPAWAKEPQKSSEPRTIRIFLASSAELREDRDAFHFDCDRLNDQLHKEGIYLKVDRWEYFLDAMSETRLQDEYNKAVRSSDIFVSLFFSKAGKYTQEEFETALGQFKATEKPLIYVYLKNADVKIGNIRREDMQSRWNFEDKVKALGHFPTQYDDIKDLKLHFRDQLPRIRELLGI